MQPVEKLSVEPTLLHENKLSIKREKRNESPLPVLATLVIRSCINDTKQENSHTL
jgi:hypothetical protein